jgi:hypothetical protein
VTPTARSLKYLREAGYTAEVTEKFNSFTKRRNDLFGFIDILAIRENEVLGVQTTSGSNVSSRVKKIQEHENVAAVRKAGIGIHVHGWRKAANGRWQVRVEDIS